MNILFTVDDENCERKQSLGVKSLLRITMSKSQILTQMEEFKVALLSFEKEENSYANFGFKGRCRKLTQNEEKNC